MSPVGRYALSLEFSDGHGSGIYGFNLLRSVGGQKPAQAASEEFEV